MMSYLTSPTPPPATIANSKSHVGMLVYAMSKSVALAMASLWATQPRLVRRAEQLWLKQSEITSMQISETSGQQG
jgi:hypothetical protein